MHGDPLLTCFVVQLNGAEDLIQAIPVVRSLRKPPAFTIGHLKLHCGESIQGVLLIQEHVDLLHISRQNGVGGPI